MINMLKTILLHNRLQCLSFLVSIAGTTGKNMSIEIICCISLPNKLSKGQPLSFRFFSKFFPQIYFLNFLFFSFFSVKIDLTLVSIFQNPLNHTTSRYKFRSTISVDQEDISDWLIPMYGQLQRFHLYEK